MSQTPLEYFSPPQLGNFPKVPGAKDPQLVEEIQRLKLKRRFSQNFLLDRVAIENIVQAADPQPGELLLEIGAGAGSLTRFLLETQCDLTAVELEREMVQHLGRRFGERPNLHLVAQDILHFDFTTWPEGQPDAPFKVVGNLPYAITTPILFTLMGNMVDPHHGLRQRMSRMVLMVQREVAERLVATPGKKAYNPLSIAAQCWFDGVLAFDVPPRAFSPAPKVMSSVVVFWPRQSPRIAVENLKTANSIIRRAFQQRRKTIRNTIQLAGMGAPEFWESTFETLGIDSQARPETLSIEQFGALAAAYDRARPSKD